MDNVISFIKDCKGFMKKYPLEKGDNKRSLNTRRNKS